jgi:hypothetical protein
MIIISMILFRETLLIVCRESHRHHHRRGERVKKSQVQVDHDGRGYKSAIRRVLDFLLKV